MNRKGIGGRKSIPAKKRFDAKWAADEITGCWVWCGGWGRDGYGVMWSGKELGRPSNIPAHRISWRLHRGDIPAGMIVCHRCDNPKCVNPDHLFLGTHKDNTQDMLAKNRSPKGEASWRAKITEADVHVIRDRRNPVKELAARYGLSISGVEMVRYRRTWKHVP